MLSWLILAFLKYCNKFVLINNNIRYCEIISNICNQMCTTRGNVIECEERPVRVGIASTGDRVRGRKARNAPSSVVPSSRRAGKVSTACSSRRVGGLSPPSIEAAARAPPQQHIYTGVLMMWTHNRRGRARFATPLARGAALSLFSLFLYRLSLADAAALRPMRAPPCRAASWPRSGRRPRRRSWPTSLTRRSTWSARGAAAAQHPLPLHRGPLQEIQSLRFSTTVRELQRTAYHMVGTPLPGCRLRIKQHQEE